MKNASVEKVLQTIEEKSDYYFLYNNKLVNVDRKVSVRVKNAAIADVLNKLFASEDVEYQVEGNQIILSPKEKAKEIVSLAEGVQQQQKTITGKVTDSNGEPLPGATVMVKGTTIGTVTDADGNYSLSNVPDDATLVFSFVGMETQEINVGNRTRIDVTLQEEAVALQEVIAIGYGTARRSEITGAVGVARGEDLLKQPSVNPLQSLAGKVPGVNIFSNSGRPSGQNRVIIRGMGTINASTQPLYVVDGIQVSDINDLNPNDIVSIEVLKDASSAAIYGARGSNGVLLITTKRGLKERGIVMEYSANLSAGWLPPKGNEMYRPMNAEEFMEVQRISYENAPYFNNYPEGEEPKLILDNDLLFDEDGNPRYDTNWEKEVTRTAISHNHQLNIRFGTENTSTGIFLNYTDQNGIYLNSYMKRANIKVTFDASPRKWATIGGNVSYRRIWENRPETESGSCRATTRAVYEFPPIFPVKWPDGTWSNSTQTEGTNLHFEATTNPVASLLDVDFLHDRNNINGSLYGDFDIVPHLKFRTQFGVDMNLNQFRRYFPSYLIDWGYPDGNAYISNSQSTFWQNENYFTYENTFGINNIKIMAGASWDRFLSNSSSLEAYGFKNDFFKYNNVGVSEKYYHPGSDCYDWSMNSYFFRGNYTYNNKYSLTLTGRYDGSSRFGKDNKYAFFPSVGVSWLVSDEKFMQGLEFVDWLRLRASFGETGNSEIGLYNSLATVSSGTTLIGGELASTSWPSRLANPNLKWEKNQQTNVGMDISLFKDVLSLEIDYYHKLTSDLLLNRPVPSTTGFTTIMDNIGSVLNEGIDVSVKTKNIDRSHFIWTSSLGVNYNKNEIKKLGENNEDIFPGPFWVGPSHTILRVGEPISSFWGYIREGIYSTDEAEEAAKVGKKPGMIKRSAEPQIIGKGLPDYVGSFINEFRWGNVDAIIDLQFSLGADVMQQMICTAEDRQALTNGIKTQLYESWTPDRQNTMIPMIRNTNLSGQDITSDSHWICDGSFLRGNLLSVGYTFPKNMINNIGIENLRINFNLQNAFVIKSKDFKDYDPESDGMWSGSNFGQNIFFYQYPKPRTLSLGLSVRF
jgi:TonB-linked SusC/RagA family outer membrane protein